MAARGDQTRERLLDAAEQLFGSEGLTKVSFRQIRLAADQGNSAAVQYYFGDRPGVIQAIADRHTPALRAIQEGLLSDVAPHGPDRFRGLVEALVRPPADYADRGPSERAWIKILAELLAEPTVSEERIAAQSDAVLVQVGRQVHDELVTAMPSELASERIRIVTLFSMRSCADRARVRDEPRSVRRLSAPADFARNLVDMAVGALSAPVTLPEPVE